jgi:predicted NBD/HSP70 family sugar kinase
MIGLELFDSRALAVRLDAGGLVLRQASVGITSDLAAAALAALDDVRQDANDPIGVTAALPEAPSVASAMVAIGKRFPGIPPASASGVAAAVAESWLGAGRGFHDVAFFAVAEHATGGIVRDGRPVDGEHRRAASVGWLALNPVEREDYRKIGCLEAEVAAAGVVRRLIWRIKAGDHSSVQKAAGGSLAAITVDHILEAAREGDGVCVSVVRDTAKYLGMAAANLIVITDPQVLVLGGLMASAADLFLEPVRTETARRLPKPLADLVTLAPAAFKDDAPAVGAARLAAIAVP